MRVPKGLSSPPGFTYGSYPGWSNLAWMKLGPAQVSKGAWTTVTLQLEIPMVH